MCFIVSADRGAEWFTLNHLVGRDGMSQTHESHLDRVGTARDSGWVRE